MYLCRSHSQSLLVVVVVRSDVVNGNYAEDLRNFVLVDSSKKEVPWFMRGHGESFHATLDLLKEWLIGDLMEQSPDEYYNWMPELVGSQNQNQVFLLDLQRLIFRCARTITRNFSHMD